MTTTGGSSRGRLRTSFAKSEALDPFYSGGAVAVIEDAAIEAEGRAVGDPVAGIHPSPGQVGIEPVQERAGEGEERGDHGASPSGNRWRPSGPRGRGRTERTAATGSGP